MLAYHVPSNLGVGKHEKEEVHGYCGRRTAAGGAGPTGKERHKGSFRWVLRRHVRHLVAHRALPYSRWSYHGNRGHVPLLSAHKCRTTEPLAGHPLHHRDRSPGHLALGPCDHLHKRALPHQRSCFGFRAWLQSGGRPPGVLCLLPGWPGEVHALRVHCAPLLVIGAILIIVGAAWGPETRDVDFSEDVQEAGETGGREAETSPRTTADRTTGGS